MFYFCASSGKSKFRYSNEQHGHDRLFFFFMKPIFHGFCIRCTLFFFVTSILDFFFSLRVGEEKLFLYSLLPRKTLPSCTCYSLWFILHMGLPQKTSFFFQSQFSPKCEVFQTERLWFASSRFQPPSARMLQPSESTFRSNEVFFFFFFL